MRDRDYFNINKHPGLDAKINRLARTIRRRRSLTAVGIAVLHSDSAVHMAAHGLRKRGGSKPVSIDDKWHIGSVTKSLTATLIAILVENKVLDLNNTLPKLMPGLNMNESWYTCTLRNLLTHTSGLPPNFAPRIFHLRPTDQDKLTEIRKQLVEQSLSDPASRAPGSEFEYSNVGYTVAALAAEIATGKNYQTLLAEYVLSKIGLANTGFGPPKGDKPEDQPLGHRVRFGFRSPVDPHRDESDNSPVILPAGGLHMSLLDLVTYGKEHLEEGRNNSSLLEEESWKQLHQPVLNNYACGWIRQEKRWADGNILWHNGSNTLWYALLILIPKKKCGDGFCNQRRCTTKSRKSVF